MPTVDGKKFPYTPEGKRAAARARARTRTEGSKTPFDKTRNPDEVKTKGDLLAENIIPTIKNMGYYGGYKGLPRGIYPPCKGLSKGLVVPHKYKYRYK